MLCSYWGGDTTENPYGRWMGGSFRKYYLFVAPSCKLEHARFSAELRVQDGAECGSNDIFFGNNYTNANKYFLTFQLNQLIICNKQLVTNSLDFCDWTSNTLTTVTARCLVKYYPSEVVNEAHHQGHHIYSQS